MAILVCLGHVHVILHGKTPGLSSHEPAFLALPSPLAVAFSIDCAMQAHASCRGGPVVSPAAS
jgi:hypothetical protein